MTRSSALVQVVIKLPLPLTGVYVRNDRNLQQNMRPGGDRPKQR